MFPAGQAGRDVFQGRPAWRNSYAQVARTAEECAALVTVFGGVAGSASAAFVARLRNFLIDEAIKVLPGVEMIVAVEDDVDVIREE